MMLPIEEYWVDGNLTLKVDDVIRYSSIGEITPPINAKITHIIGEYENGNRCDTIFCLDNGQVIQQDEIYRILSKQAEM